MKGVQFEARGKSLSLRLSMSAMCRYQELTGETIGVAIAGVQNDTSDMVRARGLFWASLSERVTLEEAGDLMEEIGLARAFTLVGDALALCVESLSTEEQAGNVSQPRAKSKT